MIKEAEYICDCCKKDVGFHTKFGGVVLYFSASERPTLLADSLKTDETQHVKYITSTRIDICPECAIEYFNKKKDALMELFSDFPKESSND